MAALFYWGNSMTVATATGQLQKNLITESPKMAAVMLPIAILMFAIAVILFTSLPAYYHQTPGTFHPFSPARSQLTHTTRQNPQLLPHPNPPQTHPLVHHKRNPPKLLPLLPLRPQLVLPLEFQTRPCLRHHPPHPLLLPPNLVPLPLPLLQNIKHPFLGPPHLRNRPRRPPLGTNALGNLRHRRLGPMDARRSHRRRARRQESVALVGCLRRHPKRRLRNHASTDVDADTRRRDFCGCAAHRYGYHLAGQGDESRSGWAR